MRFLGVDTPEIKEKQPLAAEAKAYTKQRCANRGTIWLTFQEEKADHYGRLLAWVWTMSPGGGYECVNEGLVSAGLAGVYKPTKKSELFNEEKMVALQRHAREAKRGKWADAMFTDRDVLMTRNGAAYHVEGCEHIARSKNLKKVRESEAMDKGLHGCRTCLSE